MPAREAVTCVAFIGQGLKELFTAAATLLDGMRLNASGRKDSDRPSPALSVAATIGRGQICGRGPSVGGPLPEGHRTLSQIAHDPGILAGAKVKRFAAYWQNLRKGDRLPARADLDPADFVYCLPNILLMDITQPPLRVRYRLIGSEVVAIAKLDFTGRYLDEIAFPNAQFDWAGLYRQLVAERRPLFAQVPIQTTAEPRHYELGLFPLSSDGQTIDKAVAVEDYDTLDDRLLQDRILTTRLTPPPKR